jgi:carboxymethylenebutenolidase
LLKEAAVIVTSNITIDTDDGVMNAVESDPEFVPRGGVIVLHEGFGLNTHIVEITQHLARCGWIAVAPGLYHRQGGPVIQYDDMSSIGTVMEQLTAESVLMDINATLDYLTAKGFTDDHLAVVGFCMGGSLSFLTGTLRPLGAAVTFYGGGVIEGRFGHPSLVDQAPKLCTPWLGLYGDQDTSISTESVEALRAATAASDVDTEIVRYPEAGHGFNCNERDSYNPDAAEDGWGRALAWLDRAAVHS